MSPSNGLFTAAQVREFDRRAIEDAGIGGYTLMCRAGAAALRLLRLRWPGARYIVVFCGAGNNGGDGLVVARLARAAGLQVRTGLAGDPERLSGAARAARDAWQAAGGDIEPAAAIDPAEADVIVDGLLGTGLDRPVRGDIASVIERIRAVAVGSGTSAGLPVLALDIPSGLQADTGAVLGCAVPATATISFIAPKRGLYTGAAPDHTGPVFIDTLDVPTEVMADAGPAVEVIERTAVLRALPTPRPGAHKGHGGHVLVIGGDHGFAGAARLAGEGALRTGAGLVSVATRRAHVTGLLATRPELMVHGIEAPQSDLPPLLAVAEAVIVGPGLGQTDWGRDVLAAVAAAAHERVLLDAGALTSIAADPQREPLAAVITPHPGEAARLLGCTSGAVQADRFAALEGLMRRRPAAVVLKGAGTLVGQRDGPVAMLPGGTPALAVGGTGDVLSGIIGALLAQGLEPVEAARCGVWLHVAAAQRLVRESGGRRLLPLDLGPAIAALRDDPDDG